MTEEFLGSLPEGMEPEIVEIEGMTPEMEELLKKLLSQKEKRKRYRRSLKDSLVEVETKNQEPSEEELESYSSLREGIKRLKDYYKYGSGSISKNSVTYKLLEYIAQHGTSRGASEALDVDPRSLGSPIIKLKSLGFIKKVGSQEYTITDLGWEVLVKLGGEGNG